MSKFEEIASPADHIRVCRGLYYHHGIYVGNYEVIHYAENGGKISKGGVKITSLDSFLDGDSNLDIVRHEDPAFSPVEIIDRAKSRIGEDNYSIIFNNCEHFCNWCIEGFVESKQVQFFTTLLITAIDGLRGFLCAEAIKKWVEKPHNELIKTTTLLKNTTEELNKVSQTAKISQKIFEKVVEKNIEMDKQFKKQMENIDKAGVDALNAIKKI